MNQQQPRKALDFVWWNERNPPIQAWTHEGILCALAPGFHGLGLNGYVQLPEGHPWRGVPYDEIDVDVHQGLTFGVDRVGAREGAQRILDDAGVPVTLDPAKDDLLTHGWIGFDTAHAWDYWPEEELVLAGIEMTAETRTIREIMHAEPIPEYQTRWTLDKIINEVNHLARQVADAARASPGDGDRR